LVLFFTIVNFIIPANLFAFSIGNNPLLTSSDYDSLNLSIPNVWVIDSTYDRHGQTVTNIIKNEAPGANVHFEAVSSSDRVSSFDVANAIYKAIDDGADVINLSLGAPQMSQALENAIKDAQKGGIVVVAAAGNDPNTINYPAAYEGVVSVGAYSSYSSPGADILASGVAYNGMQGTSFAAPKITGRIAAKMYTDNVDANVAKNEVVGDDGYTRIGRLTPSLVVKDVFLNLLCLALVLDKIYAQAVAETMQAAKFNNNISYNYYNHPSSIYSNSKNRNFFSFRIWAEELRFPHQF